LLSKVQKRDLGHPFSRRCVEKTTTKGTAGPSTAFAREAAKTPLRKTTLCVGRGFVVSHPKREDNDALRMGRPFFVRVFARGNCKGSRGFFDFAALAQEYNSEWVRFAVSHPCASKKAKRWGTEFCGGLASRPCDRENSQGRGTGSHWRICFANRLGRAT
jgi:hypothetical protein